MSEARFTSQRAIATSSASSSLGPAATAKPWETLACLSGSVPDLQALSSKRDGQLAIILKEKRKSKGISSGPWQHTCIVPCSPSHSRSVNDVRKWVAWLITDRTAAAMGSCVASGDEVALLAPFCQRHQDDQTSDSLSEPQGSPSAPLLLAPAPTPMPRSHRGGAGLCCATLLALPLAVTSTGTQ